MLKKQTKELGLTGKRYLHVMGKGPALQGGPSSDDCQSTFLHSFNKYLSGTYYELGPGDATASSKAGVSDHVELPV